MVSGINSIFAGKSWCNCLFKYLFAISQWCFSIWTSHSLVLRNDVHSLNRLYKQGSKFWANVVFNYDSITHQCTKPWIHCKVVLISLLCIGSSVVFNMHINSLLSESRQLRGIRHPVASSPGLKSHRGVLFIDHRNCLLIADNFISSNSNNLRGHPFLRTVFPKRTMFGCGWVGVFRPSGRLFGK